MQLCRYYAPVKISFFLFFSSVYEYECLSVYIYIYISIIIIIIVFPLANVRYSRDSKVGTCIYLAVDLVHVYIFWKQYKCRLHQ